MVYKLKEIPPSRDLENSDLVISGAVSYEEEHVKKPDTETRAGYLRFVDLWADLWGLLQDPIRDDSEGIDGHTGHRNIF